MNFKTDLMMGLLGTCTRAENGKITAPKPGHCPNQLRE